MGKTDFNGLSQWTGRIGGLVFKVVNGKQVIVPYKKEVFNPRTAAQMSSRADVAHVGGAQPYWRLRRGGKLLRQRLCLHADDALRRRELPVRPLAVSDYGRPRLRARVVPPQKNIGLPHRDSPTFIH